MALNGTSETQLTGRVVAVNDKGLKFEGAGAWLNVSKYAVGVVLPERGADVTVTLDKAGFLRAVEPADGCPLPRIAGASDVTMPMTSKDRTITRLACLKAAAEFGAARPSLKSGEILKIATSWERWVNRSDDADDLSDAF